MKSNVKKILKKELRETLRDKKSLTMMLVIPFMIPLFLIGYSAFFDMSMNKEATEYNKIGFDYELSEEEILIAKELEIDYSVKDRDELKEAYDNGELDLYITKDGTKYTMHGVNTETTAYALTLAEAYFEVYKQYLQIEYLENNDINSEEVMNIITLEADISDEETFYVTYMLSFAFTFIIMAITVASTYPSTDTTAGEKERGTLETLLTFPVKSRDIIVGKFLNVSLTSMFTGLFSLFLTLISFVICNSMFSLYETTKLSLNLFGIIYSIIVIVAYSFLISGLCIAVSSKSKSFKEAQSALTPFTFIAVFPGLIVSMVEVESSTITSMIPFLNFSLLFNEIAASNVNVLHILLMFVSTVLIIVIIFKIIVKQYKTENILFSN